MITVLGQIARVFPLRHPLLAAFAAYTPGQRGAFPWWHVAVAAAFRWTAAK